MAPQPSSEFESETFLFEFLVFVEVESIEFRVAFGGGAHCLVEFGEQFEVLHLLCKIPTVEMHVENGFVEHLQLAEREFLGKQFETDGAEVDAFA